MLGDLEAGRLDVTGPYPADFGRSNQTAFLEHLEVLHNGGEGDVQGLSERLRGPRRAAELCHNCSASWISESMEDSAHGGLVKH
jgi:hypothetical protein